MVWKKIVYGLILISIVTFMTVMFVYYFKTPRKFTNQNTQSSEQLVTDKKIPQSTNPSLSFSPKGEDLSLTQTKKNQVPDGHPVIQSEGNARRVCINVTQQVQRAWNTCAPTTVSMMLSSQGIEVSQENLANEMGTDTTFGTHNIDAIRVLNKHLFGYESPQDNQAGYRLETITSADKRSEQMTLFKERLKKDIDDGYPLYFTFDNAYIYSGSHGEHNVIGMGYQLSDDGTDISYLYYIDPSYTKQDVTYGGLKKITPEELLEAMLTCSEPNYAW